MKVNKRKLSGFLENLAFLMDTGVDVLSAVTALEDTKDKATATIAKMIRKELVNGNDLSVAFSRHASFFGSDNSAYISAGIKSGTLPQVLTRLADSLGSSETVKKQVRGAMMYPAFLLVITIAVSIYMFTSLVPQMAANIKEVSGSELPGITLLVLGISNALRDYKVLILIGALGFCAGLKIVHSVFRTQISELATRMPLVGRIIAGSVLTEYYLGLGNLILSGMPLADALTICAAGIKSPYISRCMAGVIQSNKQGQSFGEAMSKLTFIAPMEQQCIAVAEVAGKLPYMLEKLAIKKRVEVAQVTKSAFALVEPIMLLLMGGIIGTIVIAVYMPILSMTGY